jgi:hypothetical protein
VEGWGGGGKRGGSIIETGWSLSDLQSSEKGANFLTDQGIGEGVREEVYTFYIRKYL